MGTIVRTERMCEDTTAVPLVQIHRSRNRRVGVVAAQWLEVQAMRGQPPPSLSRLATSSDQVVEPGGGLYTGSGGGRCTGACKDHYRSNQPPRESLLQYLAEHSMDDILRMLEAAGF
jgi:hypothetical protein